MRKWLECTECGAQFDLLPMFDNCPTCKDKGDPEGGDRGALGVRYELSALRRVNPWREGARQFWDYGELLPVEKESARVSMGEGNTPLVVSSTLVQKGYPFVYFKMEAANPTWSHKDRLNTVSISKAKEFGYENVTSSTTGNHGLSTAAYAARAGMRVIVLFPPEAPKTMVEMTAFFGADALVTGWHAREPMVEHLVAQGWYPAWPFLPGRLSNPYGVEGYKTIAYELFQQLGRVPDWVVTPVAAGNALYGIWKGFCELHEIGLCDQVPRMVACLPSGANAMERSYAQHLDHVVRVETPYSIATSTMEETNGVHALRAVYDSGGTVHSVDDAGIVRAIRQLAREGICAEAASAIPFAVIQDMIHTHQVGPEESVVCLLTSGGVKSSVMLSDLSLGRIHRVGAGDMDALSTLIERR